MENSYLVNSFSKDINISLKDKTRKRNILEGIAKYIDRNSEILYNNIPSKRLIYNEEYDRKLIYDNLSINPEDVKNVSKNIPSIDSKWKILNDPYSITMILLIREATISKDKQLLDNSLLYLTLSLYSSLQYKYFKYVNEDCMLYTLNNISNKFLFKQYGSVIKALIHTFKVNHETYIKDIISSEDRRILEYLMNLRNRLNNLLKNFMNEYKKNYQSRKYLAHEKEEYDTDNYHENENLSLDIAKISEHVSLKFFTSGINLKLVNTASSISSSDKNILKLALENMKDNESTKVKELISLILQIFLTNGENTIENIISKKFITDCINLYTTSNTNDDRLIQVKNLLDYFLTNNCERYTQTSRLATKGNYRKALFIYFVLFIQYAQQLK